MVGIEFEVCERKRSRIEPEMKEKRNVINCARTERMAKMTEKKIVLVSRFASIETIKMQKTK